MLKKLNRHNASAPQERPVKVLQFGEGNFLRAFADWIIDILNEKTDFNAAVQVVQPIANGMGDKVNAQEGLYHVILNGIQQGREVKESRLITCLSEVINPFTDFRNYLAAAENPSLKFILSNTTEAGIVFSAQDTNPEILPDTFPGKLAVFLHHRFNFFKGDGVKGLVLLPCELIEKNGEALKRTVLQYAHHWNLSDNFKTWIRENNTFCNTLVDRIVPGFPKERIDEIQKDLGYEDNLVVTAEPFHLWVIEGPENLKKSFPAEKAGLHVKFVDDLTPYRTRKVRILNGAHTAMVPVAYLRGLRTVREAIEDPETGAFVRKVIFEEIIPTLDLPAPELNQFAKDVIERFQNPFIHHELASIALNSVSKFQVRVLPSLLEFVKRKNKIPVNLVHSFASLIAFYKGEWDGEKMPLNDTAEVTAFFYNAWQTNDPDNIAEKTLSNNSFWNVDLSQISGLNAAVKKELTALTKQITFTR